MLFRGYKEDMDFNATNSASYLNSNANFVMKGDREKIRDISIPTRAAGLRARLVGGNNIRSYTIYRNLLHGTSTSIQFIVLLLQLLLIAS